jgi:hypothetical protein
MFLEITARSRKFYPLRFVGLSGTLLLWITLNVCDTFPQEVHVAVWVYTDPENHDSTLWNKQENKRNKRK